jgi:hypothetical protein
MQTGETEYTGKDRESALVIGPTIDVPTGAREHLAGKILREHVTDFVNLMGRFTITELVPGKASRPQPASTRPRCVIRTPTAETAVGEP